MIQHQKPRLLLILALIPLIITPATAIQFTVADGTAPPDPSKITTTDMVAQFTPSTTQGKWCIHTYGSKCTYAVKTAQPITSCEFEKFDCVYENRVFTLTYPKEGEEVPNTPSIPLTDNGSVCFGETCLGYDISTSVFNLNYRMEAATGAEVWVWVSPNGYNVIPILGTLFVVFIIWRYQKDISKRYHEIV
jgi:hypothetical protein